MKHRQPPSLSTAGQEEARAKQQRLGAALRENLLKRKVQQRARAGDHAERPPAADGRDAEK
jgi:hypothetical protein